MAEIPESHLRKNAGWKVFRRMLEHRTPDCFRRTLYLRVSLQLLLESECIIKIASLPLHNGAPTKTYLHRNLYDCAPGRRLR